MTAVAVLPAGVFLWGALLLLVVLAALSLRRGRWECALVAGPEGVEICCRLRLFWNLVSVPLPPDSRVMRRKAEKKAARGEAGKKEAYWAYWMFWKKRHPDQPKSLWKRVLATFRREPASVLEVTWKALRESHICELSADGAFGVGDAAQCALVWGAARACFAGLGFPGSFRVRPLWDRVALEGELRCVAELKLLRIAWHFIKGAVRKRSH